MMVERSYIQNKQRTTSLLHLNCKWPHQILQWCETLLLGYFNYNISQLWAKH